MFINSAKYDKIDNELYYEKQFYSIENDFDEVFVDFVKMKTTCKNCQEIFKSYNKLHKHLKLKQCFKRSSQKNFWNKYQNFFASFDLEMIKVLTCTKDFEFDVKFRNWNFSKTLIKFFVSNSETHVCVDIDWEAILNNKKFV